MLNANVKPGDHVVVIGAAGGLGHFAVQYAAAHSAHVIAIDTGASKRDFLASIGCNTYIDILTMSPAEVIREVHDLTRDHTLSSHKSKATSGAHAVIVTAGNPKAYETAAELLRTGGSMSCVGIPPPGKMPEFPIAKVVIKGLRIYGNLVGNMKETLEAVDFVRRGVVKPHVVVRPWRELEEIYGEMEKGEIVGRVVIAVGGEVPASNGVESAVGSKKRKIGE